MTYRVLSLKWRPQSFKDIIGQDHVSKTLVNSIKLNRIGQGYIFTGPRGVGKTTTARILAMALNSEDKPSVDFDPNSSVSKEIANGRSLDVVEIDGASNRGIEEIRNLREQIKFSPMEAQYKIIIILYLDSIGANFICSLRFRISSIPRFDAPSISTTSSDLPLAISFETEEFGSN